MKKGLIIIICLSLTAFFTPQKGEGQPISGIINSYHKATAIINNGTYNSYSYSGITLQSIAGLSTGDRVLIIQMKGATIDQASNNANFGNITDIGDAGKYEFSSICGFLNNTIVLTNHLLNTYDVSKTQVIRVPVFTDVTISGELRATEWDPVSETGGVIALEASGTITLNASINADSAGFKGGALFLNTTNRCGPRSNYFYSLAQSSSPNLGGATKGEGIANFIFNKEYGRGKQSNGGGGGNVDETGGGGGSNYGIGGGGGNKTNSGCAASTHGEGGTSLSLLGYSLADNRIFLGGGGGCGEMNNYHDGLNPPGAGTPGGDGGGIIFIKCNNLVTNSNTISANGGQGINPYQIVKTEGSGDGGGGGGGGGVVLLDVTTYTGSLSVEAKGANGSNVGFQNACPGPGGGGGGGIIWHSGTLPGTVTTSISGGASGIIKDAPSHNPPCEGLPNGATAGSAGLVQSGFVTPQGTNTINCAILLLDLLQQFTGKRSSQSIQLNWTLTTIDHVQKIWLEGKTGN